MKSQQLTMSSRRSMGPFRHPRILEQQQRLEWSRAISAWPKSRLSQASVNAFRYIASSAGIFLDFGYYGLRKIRKQTIRQQRRVVTSMRILGLG
ncbi:MAG: hypothetical protein PVI39_08105 [Desulfobacteraceae bacterium]|jgi:hypothetical protein